MSENTNALLTAVQAYLHKEWAGPEDLALLQGYIDRGKSRLDAIAGSPQDYDVEGLPRALLLDYCRYADAQALEVFEHNFRGELISLNLAANISEGGQNGN